MKKSKIVLLASLLFLFLSSTAIAGPYTGDGIAGFVGPDGDGVVSANNYVNPVFSSWASRVVSYQPFDLAEIQNYNGGEFSHPERTLGAVTGDGFDIASLGDMNAIDILAWQGNPSVFQGPGEITLGFSNAIYNGSGYDFAVFENGFTSQLDQAFFAELGYVYVSTDGNYFAGFDSVSMTPGPVGAFGTIDPTDIHNLAGKHPNNYGLSYGTGFDLDDLEDNALVLAGLVDLDDINYVKIVDIPGNGSFRDSQGNPIYDAWETFGSGGVDLEAVGVINAVPNAIPVPGAIWLMASGLLGLAGIQRKKRRS